MKRHAEEAGRDPAGARLPVAGGAAAAQRRHRGQAILGRAAAGRRRRRQDPRGRFRRCRGQRHRDVPGRRAQPRRTDRRARRPPRRDPTGGRLKKALITGVTGQDGSYLAELLLDKGYQVWGLVRRSSDSNTSRIRHLANGPAAASGRFRLAHGNLGDSGSLASRPGRGAARRGLQPRRAVRRPHLVRDPGGDQRVRRRRRGAAARGNPPARPRRALLPGLVVRDVRQGRSRRRRRETTPFHPRSPYAAAKVFAYHLTRNYRESYGIFAVNGILFNHESPRRGENFVTRKITPRRRAHQARARASGCGSATCRPSATGATPPTTSTPCGGCSRSTSPTTT